MPIGDAWLGNMALGQVPDLGQLSREIGTPEGGLVTDYMQQMFSPVDYGALAARNQARGMQAPMEQLEAQSNPLIAQLRQQAGRGIAQNPYQMAMADRARQAQLALIGQMRNQMAGPSLAGMQGQQALAQSGQRALGAAAMGAPNRAAMLQSQRVGAGLAGDVGQARLAEVMRAQGGMGGVASGLRGRDLTSAESQMQSGLRAQTLADENARWAASQGAALSDANRNAQLEYYKLLQRLQLRNQQKAEQTRKDTAQAIATVVKMGAGGI